jgi:hypothetical protein
MNAHTTEAGGGRELVWAAVAARYREQQLQGRFILHMQVREESDIAISVEGYDMQRELWVRRP